jgi:hypothetical protein
MAKKPTYEPSVGEHLDEAIESAKEEATRHGEPVSMTFNGIKLSIASDSKKEDVVTRYHAEQDKKAEEYHNSPEGKAAAEKYRQQNDRDQQRITSLVQSLPDAIKSGEAAVVKWVGDFSEVNDNINMNYDKVAIAEALKAAGYKNNGRVGDPEVKTNPTAFAEWLVGLAINNLEAGIPIHPIAEKFSKDYEQLAGKSGRADGNKWSDALGSRGGRGLE